MMETEETELSVTDPDNSIKEGVVIDQDPVREELVAVNSSEVAPHTDNGEPMPKKVKLDVVVPDDYQEDDDEFPADWKEDGEEDDDDEDEQFAISLDEVKPRIDVRKALLNKKNIDFNDVPEINGVPVNEFNIDALDEKPWKKPGADVSDYFNYGFNEDTWRMYCDKQRRMRSEAQALEITHGQISTLTKNENSKYTSATHPGGPSSQSAPFRAQFRRRPNQDGGGSNQIQVLNDRKPDANMMPPLMMPVGPGLPFLPPPGMMGHPMVPPMMMRPMDRMQQGPPQQNHHQQQSHMPSHGGGGVRRQLTAIQTTNNPTPKDA